MKKKKLLEKGMKKGFSLVELSIVLVILGLLTGGILTGQSLIRAAELRSVVTQVSQYATAFYGFRDKYIALPGDMAKAEDFWGSDPDGCPTHTNRVAKKETCNGNDDGRTASGSVDIYERFRVWQHLANAGLVEGSYTGVAGAGGDLADGGQGEIGINMPAMRLSGVGAGIYTRRAGHAGTTEIMYIPEGYGATFVIGARGSGSLPTGPFATPEEVWNMDAKLDDGKPFYGKVIARYWDVCSDAADNADRDAQYLLSETARNCALFFRL